LFSFRIRDQSAFLLTLRSLPTYSDIPLTIRDYLESNSKPTISQTFDPLRTLTPISNLSTQPVPTSPHSQMLSRMNNVTAITTNQQQYVKENSAQKGVYFN